MSVSEVSKQSKPLVRFLTFLYFNHEFILVTVSSSSVFQKFFLTFAYTWDKNAPAPGITEVLSSNPVQA